ncbi:CLUMA_CG011994, isoform A [Clunio marinus]|uniref:CLUMA_CG011994, isoform A n=1 Tax=Clunio marinus TaxID=568069 RepID=A0A1J1IGK9_9DIPT|nr:CLUMA_CG011994, isoform A [Clunio marinus]
METSLRIITTTIILLWSIQTYKCTEGFKPDENVEKVLVNGVAEIKCDVSSNIDGDQVLLVVWYKNNLPIYSYDTRGSHAGTPSHWKDNEILENRAIFRTIRSPAELVIKPVQEKDAGNFRCRVDFKLSPTRNSNVNLQVVVPPAVPVIYNEQNLPIESRAGPYEESGQLILACVVMGGSPAPKVKWYENGKELPTEANDYSFPSSKTTNKLIVKNLSRIHQHAVYTCQASNFPNKFVSKNITIELYCELSKAFRMFLHGEFTFLLSFLVRPLEVEIMFNNQPLSADRQYEVECQAIGSRPPSVITWWMNGVALVAQPTKTSPDGNITTSTLLFTPTRQDNGKNLVCRATNELVRNGIKETTLKMNVFYPPSVTLQLGPSLNPDDIEEGDDCYFECIIKANPPTYKVVWRHNGLPIAHNTKRTIMSSDNLALQAVSRYQAGNYTCVASNVEGDGESNVVELKVMYKPICRSEQKRIYGVARNEAAEILCEVDAFPPPESFKWSFNNTAETFEMPQSDYRIHSSQASTLSYTPVKEVDFGTILCWADNVVGQQKEPCVFHLIAAGKPDVPYNCTLVNQTSESLEVDCNEGFDGGQRQWFIMEIFDQHTNMLQANISSKYPVFTVSGLDSGKFLKIVIYAINVKGRSDSVLLEAFTLKAAEKQTGQHESLDRSTMLSFGILVGLLTALVCVIIGIIVVLKIRTANNKKSNNKQRPGNLPIKEKISVPLSQSEEMYDEKNPDVVPSNEDPEYKLKSANQTPTALSNALTNNHEISRNIMDERKAFIKGAGDVHYAELTLQMPKDETKSLLNHAKKPPPPPAYSAYFDDPTIYAQIDHCNFSKSSTANLLGSSGQSLNNGSLKTVGSGVSGSLMMTEQNTQFNQLLSPLTQTPTSTTQSNQTMLISGNSIGSSGCISSSGTLSITSSTTPTATFTSISAGATSQFPSNNYHTQTLPLPSANKQFLRDIVTVKTPLSFSEQESCV